MLSLSNKPFELQSKFWFRMGLSLLFLGSVLLTLGIIATLHTRENVIIYACIVTRAQDKMASLGVTSSGSKLTREVQSLSDELAFYEPRLREHEGYFLKAILILASGVLVSSGGFCLAYLNRRKTRRLAYAEAAC